MAIADTLNLLLTSPTEQLKKDLAQHGLTVRTFATTVAEVTGRGTNAAIQHIHRMSEAWGVAVKEQVMSAKEAADGYNALVNGLKYVEAGGDSYGAMVKEVTAVEAKHETQIAKTIARMNQLNAAFKAAKKPNSAALQKEFDELSGLNDVDKQIAQRRAQQRAKQLQEDAAFQAKLVANRQAASQRKAVAVLTAFTSSPGSAEWQAKVDASRQAQQNVLVGEANSLNLRHASVLELRNQEMLRLNAMMATGALTQAAYNAEVAATNRIYAQSSGIQAFMTRIGFSIQGLRAALGLFNPWLIAVTALGAGVKVFADFERAMSRVAAYSLASNKQLAGLADTAQRLGKNSMFSATEVAGAMTELAKAGFTAEDIQKSIGPTLTLATIGMMDLQHATEIAARAMAGMHIPAEGLSDIVDALAVAEAGSVTSVESLGEALKFVGPVAAQAGMSLDDVMASLMVLGNAGLEGEIAGTGLRNVVLRFINPTKEAAAAFAELAKNLGMTAFHLVNAQGKMMPMLAVIKQFEQGMKNMGDMERLQTLGKIARTRGTTILSALIGAGSEQYEQMLKLQEHRQGVGKAQENIQNDNAWGDLKRAWSALSSLASESNVLGFVLRGVINVFTMLVQLIEAALIVPVIAFKIAIFTLLLPVGLVVSALGGLAWAIGWVVSKIPGFGKTGDNIKSVGSSLMNNRIVGQLSESIGHSADKEWEALSGAVGSGVRAITGGNSEAERKKLQAQLNSDDSQLAKMANDQLGEKEKIDRAQQQVKLQDDLVKKINDETKAKRQSAMVSSMGEDAGHRQSLLAEGLLQIEQSRQHLAKIGINDTEKYVQNAQRQLRASIAQLKVEQELDTLAKKKADFVKEVVDSKKKVDTVGMTDGQKALYALGKDVMPADRQAAAFMDNNFSTADLKQQGLDEGKKVGEMQRQLDVAKGLYDEYEATYRAAQDKANIDGTITQQEREQLDILKNKLAAQRDINKELEIQKIRTSLKDDLDKTKLDANTVGMTPGQKYMFELGQKGVRATAGDIDQGHELDNAKARLDMNTLINATEQEGIDLQRQRDKLMDGKDWTKYDEIFAKADNAAMADGIFTHEEQAMLDDLDILLEQNEAWDEQIAAIKKRNEEAKKYHDDLKKHAEDLKDKADPMREFKKDFVELSTMKKAGLIDQKTFDIGLEDARNKALKSAGPQNIGSLDAKTQDSVEGQSAYLKQLRNPEYDELVKQTKQAEQSKALLAKIDANTKKFQKVEANAAIPL